MPTHTAAAAALSVDVARWDANTSTGTIVYDVTVNGTCSASRCYWALDAFYVDDSVQQFQGGIATGSAYGDSEAPRAFATRLSGRLEGSAGREITHLKVRMDLSTGLRQTSDLRAVSAPYPDPWVTLTVSKWRLHSTGYTEYDLTINGGGLGQRLGPCSDVRCAWGIEAYSTSESGRRLERVLYSASNVGDRMWNVNKRVTSTSLHAPNVTHLRAYVRPHSCTVPCPYETVEAWHAVSSYVYKDHDMERTAEALAPVLAANGQFFCTYVLLKAGTRYSRSSLTDQYIACEAVIAAGAVTIYAVAQPIVDEGGGPTLDVVVDNTKNPFPRPTEVAVPIPPQEWEDETGCEQGIPEWTVDFAAERHVEPKHGYSSPRVHGVSYWDYGVPWEELVYPYAMKYKAVPGTQPDTCIRVIDYPAIVGYRPVFEAQQGESAWELTTTYTVVTDKVSGALRTAFPGRPGDDG